MLAGPVTRGSASLYIHDGVTIVQSCGPAGFSSGETQGSLLVDAGSDFLNMLRQPLVKVLLRPLWLRWRSALPRLEISKEIMAELEGYASGTGVPLWMLMLGNFLFDLYQKGPAQCTTFVLHGADGMVIGRNTDINPWLARLLARWLKPLVIQVAGPDIRSYVHVSIPGFVGVMNGVNDAGISVHSHLSVDVKVAADCRGLPAALLSRRILENAATLLEVDQIVRDARVQAPINLLVTSASQQDGRIYELLAGEFSAQGLGVMDNACTTHFRSASMALCHSTQVAGSRHRLEVLEGLLRSDPTATAVRAIEILRSRVGGNRYSGSSYAICNPGTFQSFVMDLPGGSLHIATGRRAPVPIFSDYVEVPFQP